jgi:beta-exotoxin I transport system permease protein
MMLSSVGTKGVRDRWKAFVVGAVAIALLLLMAMWAYAGIDLAIYADLPEAVRNLMGIDAAGSAAGVAYGAIYGFMGAMTLAGLAIWVGSSSIAGEERGGSMGLLLSNPRSRTRVLLESAVALVLLTALGALIILAGAYLSPLILDVSVGGRDLVALSFHLFVNALFYGALALAIAGWTGNGGLATGLAAGVMILGYLAVGILPLFEGAADLARLFPWYYFDSSDPQSNGIDWGAIAVLGGASLILCAIAIVGWNRRDLRGRNSGRTMVDRLRGHPMAQRVVDRLSGSAAVSRIWTRTVSEHRLMLIVMAYIAAIVGIAYGPLYAVIPKEVLGFADQLPKELLALVGNADLRTPEGWYTIEGFGFVIPIVMIVTAMVVGSRALAGEEGNRTMGLLLANPVKRSTIVIEKTVAMVILLAVLGVVTFAATVVGSTIGGLGMDIGNIAAISLLAALLGLSFGALALLLGAATGRVSTAVQGAAGLALVTFLLNSFLPLNQDVAGYARLTPFYYYLGGDPLMDGLQWTHAGLLAGLVVAFVVLAVVSFDRRDIRRTS